MRRSHKITQMQGKVKNWGIDTIIYHTTFGGFAYRMAANIMPQSWAAEDSAAASDERLMPKLHWEAFWQKTLGIAAARAFPLSWVLLSQLVLLTRNEFSCSLFSFSSFGFFCLTHLHFFSFLPFCPLFTSAFFSYCHGLISFFPLHCVSLFIYFDHSVLPSKKLFILQCIFFPVLYS